MKKFLLLIVVFASIGYAPRVFADEQVIVSGVIGVGAEEGMLCIPAYEFAPYSDGSQAYFSALEVGGFYKQTGTPNIFDEIADPDTRIEVAQGAGSYDPDLNADFCSGITLEDMIGTPTFLTNGELVYMTVWYEDVFLTTYFQFDGISITPAIESHLSRIINIIPDYGVTVASGTPTTVGTTVFINEDDLGNDLRVTQTIMLKNTRLLQPVQGIVNNPTIGAIDEQDWRRAIWTIDTDLTHILSTTTQFYRLGKHISTTKITKPYISILGFGFGEKVIAVANSEFIVGTTTVADRINDQIASSTDALFTAGTFTDNCNPLSNFSIIGCMTSLLVISPSQSDALVAQTRDSVLTKAPVGYVTRVVDILTGEATTTLPVVGFTFKEGGPLEGEYSVDIGSIISDSSSLITNEWDSSTGLLEVDETSNFWDIIMPYINAIGYLALLIKIVSEITGMGGMGTGQIGRHTGGVTRDEYAYKEKLYKMNGGTYQGRDKRNGEWYEK